MSVRQSPEELQAIHDHAGHYGPAQASRAAEKIMTELPTDDFSNTVVAEEHGKYTRIAVVSALTAAKRATSWLDAKEFLLRAVFIANSSYPLAVSVDDALKRGNYWEGVYGSESAQLICLRDILKLVEVLVQLHPVEDMKLLLSGLQNLLARVANTDPQRFGYIYQIEYGDYTTATTAFAAFIADNGIGTERYQPEQVITVTARMLGRAVDMSDFAITKKCMAILAQVGLSGFGLFRYTQLELMKNISTKTKNALLEKRIKRWLQQLPNDGNSAYFYQLLEVFTENRYVGMGKDKFHTIY